MRMLEIFLQAQNAEPYGLEDGNLRNPKSLISVSIRSFPKRDTEKDGCPLA